MQRPAAPARSGLRGPALVGAASDRWCGLSAPLLRLLLLLLAHIVASSGRVRPGRPRRSPSRMFLQLVRLGAAAAVYRSLSPSSPGQPTPCCAARAFMSSSTAVRYRRCAAPRPLPSPAISTHVAASAARKPCRRIRCSDASISAPPGGPSSPHTSATAPSARSMILRKRKDTALGGGVAPPWNEMCT